MVRLLAIQLWAVQLWAVQLCPTLSCPTLSCPFFICLDFILLIFTCLKCAVLTFSRLNLSSSTYSFPKSNTRHSLKCLIFSCYLFYFEMLILMWEIEYLEQFIINVQLTLNSSDKKFHFTPVRDSNFTKKKFKFLLKILRSLKLSEDLQSSQKMFLFLFLLWIYLLFGIMFFHFFFDNLNSILFYLSLNLMRFKFSIFDYSQSFQAHLVLLRNYKNYLKKLFKVQTIQLKQWLF